MEKERKLIWDKQALISLEKSLAWISESSIQQAEQEEQTILDKVEIIRSYPERYPPDKYKINNSGNYRAFEPTVVEYPIAIPKTKQGYCASCT